MVAWMAANLTEQTTIVSFEDCWKKKVEELLESKLRQAGHTKMTDYFSSSQEWDYINEKVVRSTRRGRKKVSSKEKALKKEKELKKMAEKTAKL